MACPSGGGRGHHEMLEHAGDVRLGSHGDVEPDDRRTGRAHQRRVGRLASRVRLGDRIHPGGQCTSGKRLQHPVGFGVADFDPLDVHGELRHVCQHKLIGDVKAPVGAAHGAWATEHPRRKPSQLLTGHTPAGSRRTPPRGDCLAENPAAVATKTHIAATTNNTTTRPRPRANNPNPRLPKTIPDHPNPVEGHPPGRLNSTQCTSPTPRQAEPAAYARASRWRNDRDAAMMHRCCFRGLRQRGL